MRREISAERPLTVAHRAGNERASLQAACAAGVDLIEADVRYHRGRLEVRHTKTMGPVPLLWDKWFIAPGWRPRMLLADLLAAAAGCELMLDIKGGDERFPREVARAVREALPGRDYSVCSQFWRLLEPFHDEPAARVIHSIGSTAMLHNVRPHLVRYPAEAVSIHKKLLTPAVVADLLERVPIIMTWPVNREADLRALQSMGVNGFISDNLDLLRQVVREREAAR